MRSLFGISTRPLLLRSSAGIAVECFKAFASFLSSDSFSEIDADSSATRTQCQSILAELLPLLHEEFAVNLLNAHGFREINNLLSDYATFKNQLNSQVDRLPPELRELLYFRTSPVQIYLLCILLIIVAVNANRIRIVGRGIVSSNADDATEALEVANEFMVDILVGNHIQITAAVCNLIKYISERLLFILNVQRRQVIGTASNSTFAFGKCIVS